MEDRYVISISYLFKNYMEDRYGNYRVDLIVVHLINLFKIEKMDTERESLLKEEGILGKILSQYSHFLIT